MGISHEQALECFRTDDLIGIGMEADAVRRALHPEGVVSYVVDRAISLDSAAIPASLEAKVAEAVELGATGIVLRASAAQTRSLNLGKLEQILSRIRGRFPSLWLHGLSATGVGALAAGSGLSVSETLLRLQAAGLGSLSGHDAGVLVDEVQTPHERCSSADWLAVHRTAQGIGMPTTAAMLFGAGETISHRLHHLQAILQLQQETGGFTAFTPSAFQPAVAGVRGFEEATAVEYLKMLAISRMVLDLVPNLQADWPTQGLKVLQMALRFGANDVGPVMPGESLTTPDGTTEEDLRRIIRGAGFRPVQRDSVYRTVFLD